MGLWSKTKQLFKFGYDAAETSPRRKHTAVSHRSEDDELFLYKRMQLVSNTRNLLRNSSVARWAVESHLNFVSHFTFQSRNNNPVLDQRIESLMYWWSDPSKCDITGRASFDEITRLIENRAVADGDILVVRLQSGEVQLIEGDRIKDTAITEDIKPFIPDGGQMINGVIVDANGRDYGYCVHTRSGNQFVFERVVLADNSRLYAYRDRPDQVRGVSPLASALNAFQDVYEASLYALIKCKILALLGFKIRRPTSEDKTDLSGVDWTRGNFVADLNGEDDLEVIESNHPSGEFQEYMNQMLAMALKGLGIPFSFFSENFTNYSGARQAMIQYLKHVEIRRNALKRVLDEIVLWKLRTWIAAGLLVLPPGMTVYNLNWNWVAASTMWINPLQEVQADQISLALGVTSRQRLCRERGEDFNEIVAELAQENKMFADFGLQIPNVQLPTDIIVPDESEVQPQSKASMKKKNKRVRKHNG